MAKGNKTKTINKEDIIRMDEELRKQGPLLPLKLGEILRGAFSKKAPLKNKNDR